MIYVLLPSVVTETTGSISGLSITSELNEELNELIQRFHNQLHDSQVQYLFLDKQMLESHSLELLKSLLACNAVLLLQVSM